MPTSPRIFLLLSSGFAVSLARAAEVDGPPPGAGLTQGALILGAISAALGVLALVLALRARRLADHAVHEAAQARARASQAGGGGVTPEALAAVERVWSARLAALETQFTSGGTRPVNFRASERAPSDLGGRLDELERTVAGLAVTVKELRRPAAAAGTAAAPAPAREHSEIAWPASLAADTPAINDVRQTLALALKSHEPAARDLLERLRAAEQWSVKKPGAGEVAAALTEISSLLVAALRRGANVAPLDGSLLSDRVLAALRPAWKSFQPHLDCRSFYPGATFDPDWMEDRTRAGLQRPVISEMLSWAVFEKLDSGRRVLAKAHVTAD